ncbi:hypothetical protein COO91_10336 (plasmid) [Nostoc flagelliforme CCNUN1]|uniref:Uncharacterized protein n=1 Tax=Nostoc flagelliforme CCNUN1 TaxID=2038116 RepID=A0A2K8T8U5_9NOSO|nr:hypothetical protein COO91_10336 [Nostoc flagelliforme CCNUN1]
MPVEQILTQQAFYAFLSIELTLNQFAIRNSQFAIRNYVL